MTVEVVADDSYDEIQRVQRTTNRIWVSGQVFLFQEQVVAFEMSFGNQGDPVAKKTELWIASGPPVLSFMSEQAQGTSRVDVLRDIAQDLITTVQGNPALKQQLIDEGHLKIRKGTLRGLLA